MNINPTFFDRLNTKTKKCGPKCKHYYQKRIAKNDSIYYLLRCTLHGYILTVPKAMALEDISKGAPWNTKGERIPAELKER